MMLTRCRLICTSFFILITIIGFSQETQIYRQPERDYRTALELFRNEKYGAAQQYFGRLSSDETVDPQFRSDAAFYEAVCATELNHPDGAVKISDFLKKYPEHPQAYEARLYLARMFFRDNNYREALGALREMTPSSLSPSLRDEYYFMAGYASLKNDDARSARNYFSRVTNQQSAFYGPSKYYIGHIDYLDGNYITALQAFGKLENDPKYKKVVPAYKLQIYYHLGDYDKIIEEGPAMLESGNTVNKGEVARLIGDAFYRKGDFEKAVEYFELYERTAKHSLSREDNYQLGYAYFKIASCKNAIDNFQKVITLKDALSQNAYYYLAVCYNETGQEKYAGNAFLSAYKNNIDKELAEDALFSYVKLSLKTSFNPYNESVELMQNYLREHPDSKRTDEGYEYLVDLYMSSKKYKDALESIENIGYKSPKLEAAYQQLLFFRATELFNNNDPDQAISLYKKSAGYSYDKELQAEANYWIAEAFYKQADYWGAIRYYKDFLAGSSAKKIESWPTAYYNLGYCYFNREEYADAIINFRKFIDLGASQENKVRNDAFLRLADSYFITNDYSNAITYYNQAIIISKTEGDYALYQKALSEGARGYFTKKTETLKSLISQYPASRYQDDALYETALTYLIQNDDYNALSFLDKLIRGFPASSYTATAFMKKGFIYYNRDDYQNAIFVFKTVIEKYPATEESRQALASLKNIYMETGQMDLYYVFVRGLPGAEVSASEEDSLTYAAAENIYMKGDCNKSAAAFQKYLRQFPDGAFSVNASYYSAECFIKEGQKEEALKAYLFIAGKPRSKFTEKALVTSAGMEYSSENYAQALALYQQLETTAEYQQNIIEAVSGQMRCHNYLKEYPETIDAAKKLISAEKVDENLVAEAHITLAHAYMQLSDLDLARYEYEMITKLVQNEYAAEATYQLAFINDANGNPGEAENKIFELADKYAVYDDWVARGFLLLADVYLKTGNSFQAKQTLQSIIDNYKGPELGETAKKKLQEIEESESNPQ